MTDDRQLEQRLADWLHAEERVLPDPLLDRAMAQIARTAQVGRRDRWSLPWVRPLALATIATAIVALMIVVPGAISRLVELLPGPGGPVGSVASAQPTTTENRPPEGFHDGYPDAVADALDECYANGWAVDPNDLSIRVRVRISVDGEVVATLTADDFRQDLVDADVSDGFSSFWFGLGDDIRDEEAHQVLVEAEDAQTGAWRVLNDSPRPLTCTS